MMISNVEQGLSFSTTLIKFNLCCIFFLSIFLGDKLTFHMGSCQALIFDLSIRCKIVKYIDQLGNSSQLMLVFEFGMLIIDWSVECMNPAISWRPVLVVEEAGVPGENHRPWASNW
jgi:hypothetical protein